MKPLRKVQAGGIIRKSLDNTWRTPPKIAVPARDVYFGGRIPFDAATGLDNPMRAERICVGRLDALPRDVEVPALEAPESEKARRAWLECRRDYRRALAEAVERRRSTLAHAVRLAGAGTWLQAGLSEWAEVGLPDVFGRETDPVVRATVDGLEVAAWLEFAERERDGRMPFVSGLEVRWDWPTWVNPPYGRELRAWLDKMSREGRRGAEVVALLPCARWEQRYFHKMLRAVRPLHVCLITSRVAFESSIDGALVGGNPYANMLLGFNTDAGRWLDAFGSLGECQEWRTMRRSRPAPARLENEAALTLFGGER